MNTTTFVFDLPGHAAPAPPARGIPLWTPLASFARRMYADARAAGYFRPVRVVIRVQLGDCRRADEPYEDPEFV